ncbi:type II secretion system F family protein [Streptomyces sp. NPDC088923]|uniref:type II secretion system F family protein n=1 Tax=Streptomyces sp. NPDC088923 TaxID=3365913 RepID=UPI003819197C
MSAEVVHRVGIALWALTLVLLPGVLLSRRRRVVTRRRGRRLFGAAGVRFPFGTGIRAGPATARRWVSVVGAGGAVWSLVGGMTGAAWGLGAAFLVHRWMRAEDVRRLGSGPVDDGRPRGFRRPRRLECGTPADLPLAADLLAACVAAGAGPVEAAEAVGGSLDGLVGERLRHVAAEIRLGGEPERAWALFGSLPGAGGLAGLLQRATTSGAPVAAPALALAADCRARWARTAGAAARRAAVLVTAPLGLCFLPAFLILGVAPVLLGLAGELTRR